MSSSLNMRWHRSVQTLVVEEHLLPLHPLPLWSTEAQHRFELGQDAAGLLPLPTLPLLLLRWQDVHPRASAFTVGVWVGDVGLPLLVKNEDEEDMWVLKAVLGTFVWVVVREPWCKGGINRGTQCKMSREQVILPALQAQGLCPGWAGRMEEEQESQLQGGHTAPDPQHYLQGRHQKTDELNNLVLERVLALHCKGATSSTSLNSHGKGRRY